jgi:hypothetical protein
LEEKPALLEVYLKFQYKNSRMHYKKLLNPQDGLMPLERVAKNRAIQKVKSILFCQCIWGLFGKKEKRCSKQILRLSNVGNCQLKRRVLGIRKVPVAGLAGNF